jgi:hypothetical protein
LDEKQIQRREFLVKRNKIAYERDAGKIIKGCQKHRTHHENVRALNKKD